jgi:hypothetical protein
MRFGTEPQVANPSLILQNLSALYLEGQLKGDWEFFKLLIGLNSAAFEGWFLAKDRLVTSVASGIAFMIVLAAADHSIDAYLFLLLHSRWGRP